jgi:hypothetical protein
MEALTRPERYQLRDAFMARAPAHGALLFIGATTVFGVAVITGAAFLLRGVGWRELAWAVSLLIVFNAAEWWLHRGPLHHRVAALDVLYHQHTRRHHRVFVADDMAVRTWDELVLVLLPPWAIVALFGLVSPFIAALWFLFPANHNPAAVFAMTSMAYVVAYEWFHLIWHLPDESVLGRFRIVRSLRTRHTTHHDPRLMMRWNFNVTVPLWDLLLGTAARDRAAARSPRRRHSTT